MRLFPIGALSLLLALPVAAQQQDNSAQQQSDSAQQQSDSATQQQGSSGSQQKQSPPASTKKPAQPQKKLSEAEQNPFPEGQSEAAAHQAQQPANDNSSAAPAPQTAAPPVPRSSAADENPFPESQSQKAAPADQPATSAAPPQTDTPDANSSSSHIGLKDLGLSDDNTASDTKEFSSGPNPALAQKDTKVGMFYMQTGDYKGAYDRFVEAAKVDPGNADAVFGLAESARRLNRRDEAVRNYRLYLAALPDGPHAKESRKALKEMGVSSGS